MMHDASKVFSDVFRRARIQVELCRAGGGMTTALPRLAAAFRELPADQIGTQLSYLFFCVCDTAKLRRC